uniref:Small ribosomal subunit protein uS3c n=1 Tax=Microrhizoidea pickettheapsiorum TaxID=2604950 RepID=A0A5B9RFS2_9CHLO|nr:ribosomal protein S3 [Microrhizoidea pickettheapsiorum]QEG77692.1 ribosomal protein S3 [Microrhizoidea pickettheapsiorum]
MGQKVHPVGYRLGISTHHSSEWFSKIGHSSEYAFLVAEDNFIRDFFQKKTSNIYHLKIKRKNTALFINIETSEPQEILQNLESLKNELMVKLHSFRKKQTISDQFQKRDTQQYSIYCTVSQASDVSAQSIALSIKDQLEKRLPFRRAVKRSLRLAQIRGLKGMKIQISGRLNGAEIARTESERYGAVPLQTLRTPIDYTTCRADTIYGVLGIKVWVHY